MIKLFFIFFIAWSATSDNLRATTVSTPAQRSVAIVGVGLRYYLENGGKLPVSGLHDFDKFVELERVETGLKKELDELVTLVQEPFPETARPNDPGLWVIFAISSNEISEDRRRGTGRYIVRVFGNRRVSNQWVSEKWAKAYFELKGLELPNKGLWKLTGAMDLYPPNSGGEPNTDPPLPTPNQNQTPPKSSEEEINQEMLFEPKSESSNPWSIGLCVSGIVVLIAILYLWKRSGQKK
jgi:hypothetical protein